MSIYDVFSGGGRPFNKEEWAAAKQEQRQAAYELRGVWGVFLLLERLAHKGVHEFVFLRLFLHADIWLWLTVLCPCVFRICGLGIFQLALFFFRFALCPFRFLRKEEQKTKGKARLTNMLRSGKELKVFTVKSGDLKTCFISSFPFFSFSSARMTFNFSLRVSLRASIPSHNLTSLRSVFGGCEEHRNPALLHFKRGTENQRKGKAHKHAPFWEASIPSHNLTSLRSVFMRPVISDNRALTASFSSLLPHGIEVSRVPCPWLSEGRKENRRIAWAVSPLLLQARDFAQEEPR